MLAARANGPTLARVAATDVDADAPDAPGATEEHAPKAASREPVPIFFGWRTLSKAAKRAAYWICVVSSTNKRSNWRCDTN